METETKYCELTVHLKSGVRIAGHYHVPLRTSSAVRPSDAVRGIDDGFLLLSETVIEDRGETREQGTSMVRLDAISHIELPTGWTTGKRTLPGTSNAPGSIADLLRTRDP